MGYKGRDVEVVPISGNQCLVVACDSLGAIGSKELDVVNVPSYIVGRFTARVALLEVISTGAEPQVITVAISNEPSPTGEGILEGINDELKSLNMPSLPMSISTEKNVPTQQTGLGISVIGVCDKAKLRIAASESGDNVYCLGLPKVGPEVSNPDDPEIIQGKHIRNLFNTQSIHDIVPVGSTGIRFEAELLASAVNGRFEAENYSEIDIDKSAGPSTCLIFTSPTDIKMLDFPTLPFYKIGRIRPKAV